MSDFYTSFFDRNLLIGYISKVNINYIILNTPYVQQLTKYYYNGEDFHGGLLNSYVVIEGDKYGFLGQIFEIEFLEKERKNITDKNLENVEGDFNPKVKVNILFSFDYLDLELKKTISDFPNVGARVYLASKSVLKELFKIQQKNEKYEFANFVSNNFLKIDDLGGIFSRHCAIVGTTGSGKSWTAAKLIESLLKMEDKKIIILDPTGEYADAFKGEEFASIFKIGEDSYIDPQNMKLEDLYLILNPSEGAQIPKLNEAIKSLKLVQEVKKNKEEYEKFKDFIKDENIKKEGNSPEAFNEIYMKFYGEIIKNDLKNVDLQKLPLQIENECVVSYMNSNKEKWKKDEKTFGYCISMIARLNNFLTSEFYNSIFKSDSKKKQNIISVIENFIKENKENDIPNDEDNNNSHNKRLLILNLEDIVSEYNMKEIVVELMGRKILEMARNNIVKNSKNSLIVFLDEAHNFLNKNGDNELKKYKRSSFEYIAKETRKKRVFLCIITQRPGDIPEGILSQFGTFIIHNLTNSNDLEKLKYVLPKDNNVINIVPKLGSGEAILSSVNFNYPPINIKILEPKYKPNSKTEF
ncbi:hypothetical protein LN42_06415 [Marinitoga sp. 1137]|uniref:ATP-binding protein n=1 Tax=Marinitoga sp. 1137 TaxID=1545835 RepID=UPI0009508D6F|nr:ATP-binding protein [Marinitoga sp. 1137]APT76055.1 hypothetical protein LN42_06415 [Marinitoga sp. 1137]